MARIKPISIIDGISGKPTQDARVYLYHNSVTGKTETRRINYDPTKPFSEAQLACQQSFKEKKDAVVAWFAENKPSATQPTGTELYQQWHKAFLHQPKRRTAIGTFYSFVWHQLFPSKK